MLLLCHAGGGGSERPERRARCWPLRQSFQRERRQKIADTSGITAGMISFMLVGRGWPTIWHAGQPRSLTELIWSSGRPDLKLVSPISDRGFRRPAQNQSDTNHKAPARAMKGPIEKKPCSAPCSKPSRHSHSPASIMRGAMNIPATRCALSFMS